MALYKYDRSGIQLESYTIVGITAGALAYCSDSMFLVGNTRAVQLCRLSQSALVPIQSLVTYTANQQGRGVEVASSRYESHGEDTFDYNGFITDEIVISPASTNINSYLSGVKSITNSFVLTQLYGCMHTGEDIIASLNNAALSRWRQFGIKNSSITLINGGLFLADNIDLVFDGEYLWGITAADIIQYDKDVTTIYNIYSGPGSHRGIAFDNEFLYILTV